MTNSSTTTPTTSRGKVYLVGAGPGDPKLLTVRALEVFKEVDVAFYDRLISEEILQMLPDCVRKVDVGKSPRGRSMPQGEINRLLIYESKSGKNVLRLKGGDPLLFSRGEEEVEAISAEGIEYEIVPGVSSALGVPSYAGIALTRRGVASSVGIVTGHEDQSKEKRSVDFRKLASTVDTIVVLMGLARLPQIAAELVAGGARPETLVAIVESGTRSNQRLEFLTLRSILSDAEPAAVRSPALIVIGEMVRIARAIAEEKGVIGGSKFEELALEMSSSLGWCAAAEFS